MKYVLLLVSLLHACHFLYGLPEQLIFSNVQPLPKGFSYITSLSGGTGGVDVLKDDQGRRWALKTWKNQSHGINELLAGLLINNEPSLIAYSSPPEELINQSPRLGNGNHYALYALMPFIDDAITPLSDESLKTLSQYFILCSLLSYWDIKDENLIFTERGVHFVDMGGSLLYHALGNAKKREDDWSPFFVTELRTLKSNKSTSLAQRAFKDISEQEMNDQLRFVVSRSQFLLQQANDFLTSVESPEKNSLLKILARRLQHLSELYYFQNHQFPENSWRIREAVPLVDAAGTLAWTHHGPDHEPCLLMGHRLGHHWYGNLGGFAENNEYLNQTAARETKEESGSLIDLDPHQLIKMPSHDLIYFDQKSMTFSRYRTYLVETQYRDPKDFKDREYTDYVWVPVKNILEALRANKLITQEGQNTIEVMGKYILHPPFFESLKQRPIQDWLNNLINGSSNISAHTQGLVSQESTRMNFEFSPMQLRCPDDNLLEMSLAFRDGSTPNKRNDLPAPQLEQGASHHMLMNLMKEHNLNEHSLIDGLKSLYPRIIKDDETALRIISIIEKEKEFPEHYVLYHGLKLDIWFAFRILSHLRHFFDGSGLQTDVLRTCEGNFDELKNGRDLFNFIARGKNNYDEGFTRAGVSCNLTLFSNHSFGDSPSSTLDYFLEGMSAKPVEFDAIFRSYFMQLGDNPLFESLTQQLGEYYRSIPQNAKAGGLLQFFIPKENINEASFVCGGLGRIIHQNGEPIKHPQKIFDAFQNGQRVDDASIAHAEIQARLHAYLVRFPKVRVFDYFSTPTISLEAIDAKIKTILDPYLVPLLLALGQNSGLYKYTPPHFQLVAKEAIGNAQLELNQSIPPAVTAALQADVVTLKKILDEDPDADMSYLDRDTLKLVRLNDIPAYLFAQKFSPAVVKLFADSFRGCSIDCQFSFMASILKMPFELVQPELFTVLAKHIFFSYSVINIITNTEKKQLELIYEFLTNIQASNNLCFNSEISALEHIVMHGNVQIKEYLYELINKVHNIDIIRPMLFMFKDHLANERVISVMVKLAERLQKSESSFVESNIQSIGEVLKRSYSTLQGLEILIEKFQDYEAMFSLIREKFPRYLGNNHTTLWNAIQDYDEYKIKSFFENLAKITWMSDDLIAAGEKYNLDYHILAEFLTQSTYYGTQALSSSKLPLLIEGYELIKRSKTVHHSLVLQEYLSFALENDDIEHSEILKAIETENIAGELGISQLGKVFKIYCKGNTHIKEAIDILLNKIKTNDPSDRNAVIDMSNFWFIFNNIQPYIADATEYLKRLFKYNPELSLDDIRRRMEVPSNS